MSIKLIEKLSNSNGAPAFEDEVLEVLRSEINREYLVEEDSMRNLYINNCQKKDRIRVMIDAHSDEVAFMVKTILPNGLLEFLPLGGWVASNIPAHKVRIRNKEGRYHSGITTSKPPHFMTQEERSKKLDIQDIFIDIGATSYDEVVELFKIEVGAPVVPDVTFEYNEKTMMMLGKAFDNRLGCSAVVEVMNKIDKNDLEIDVVGVISSQEEVGTRGSYVSANNVKPDIAIVFEGSPADDVYRDKYRAQGSLKKGVQIRHRDSSMISSPRFTEFARSVARECNIPFQDAVRLAGGTNGGKIHLSGRGVPTIVLGIPSRYVHTHYSYASYEDYKNTVKLAIEIIKRLDKEVIKRF